MEGLDYLPMMIRLLEQRKARASQVLRYTARAEQELAERMEQRARLEQSWTSKRLSRAQWQQVQRMREAAEREARGLGTSLSALRRYMASPEPRWLVRARQGYESAQLSWRRYRSELVRTEQALAT